MKTLIDGLTLYKWLDNFVLIRKLSKLLKFIQYNDCHGAKMMKFEPPAPPAHLIMTWTL